MKNQNLIDQVTDNITTQVLKDNIKDRSQISTIIKANLKILTKGNRPRIAKDTKEVIKLRKSNASLVVQLETRLKEKQYVLRLIRELLGEDQMKEVYNDLNNIDHRTEKELIENRKRISRKAKENKKRAYLRKTQLKDEPYIKVLLYINSQLTKSTISKTLYIKESPEVSWDQFSELSQERQNELINCYIQKHIKEIKNSISYNYKLEYKNLKQ